MSLLILTKVSKFTLIASLTTLLSFAARYSPKMQQFFFYLLVGVLAIFLIALLWEGRDFVSSSSDSEDGLSNLLGGIQEQKKKRQYYLSPTVRLEITIGLVIISVCALVGAL